MTAAAEKRKEEVLVEINDEVSQGEIRLEAEVLADSLTWKELQEARAEAEIAGGYGMGKGSTAGLTTKSRTGGNRNGSKGYSC